MIYKDCRDCKRYEGNCGNHFRDAWGHINYNIPSESSMDNSIGDYGNCFVPSEEYIESKRSEIVEKLASEYSMEELASALLLLKTKNEE